MDRRRLENLIHLRRKLKQYYKTKGHLRGSQSRTDRDHRSIVSSTSNPPCGNRDHRLPPDRWQFRIGRLMLSMLNMGPKSKGAHRLKAKAAETKHLVPLFLFHDCIVIIVAVGC